jgi:predicted extracellular nuclease
MSARTSFRFCLKGLALSTVIAASSAQAATVGITEWMYNGDEFVEFTNLTGAPIDFTGWSFDDDSRIAGSVSLSEFGTLLPGESAILAELDATTFRAAWSLPVTAKIIGGNAANLGRNDEINLYDATSKLVDRLTFGDQTFPGTIRTLDISGNPSSLALLDLDTSAGWVLSSAGDSFGSYTSTGGKIGNPGVFVPPVPLPAALPLLLSGLVGFAAIRRCRSAAAAGDAR